MCSLMTVACLLDSIPLCLVEHSGMRTRCRFRRRFHSANVNQSLEHDPTSLYCTTFALQAHTGASFHDPVTLLFVSPQALLTQRVHRFCGYQGIRVQILWELIQGVRNALVEELNLQQYVAGATCNLFNASAKYSHLQELSQFGGTPLCASRCPFTSAFRHTALALPAQC